MVVKNEPLLNDVLYKILIFRIAIPINEDEIPHNSALFHHLIEFLQHEIMTRKPHKEVTAIFMNYPIDYIQNLHLGTVGITNLLR